MHGLVAASVGFTPYVLAGCGIVAAAIYAVNFWWQRKYARIIADLFDKDATLKPRRESPDPSAQHWTVMTSDRVGLSVRLLKNRVDADEAPLIIFCHEFGSDGWSALYYAEALLEAGFDVLTFDFGNHGESDSRPGYRPCIWLSEYEVCDARAVVRFALADPELGPRVTGIMGLSRGAGAALIVAAETPEIPTVMVEAVYSTRTLTKFFVQRWMKLELSPLEYRILPLWHILWTVQKGRALVEQRRGCQFADLENRLSQLATKDVLFVSGLRDSYVPLEVISSVVRSCGHSPDEIWRVPRAKHNQARTVDPAEFDERVIALFSAQGGVLSTAS